MIPAPTIAPDAQPRDVIIDYLSRGDAVAVELWKYCADEWANKYYAFDPENYFREQAEPAVEPEIESDDTDDGDSDETDGPTFDLEEDTGNGIMPLTPEIQEQLVLYGPLCVALKEFWTSMMIFTEDNPLVADWAGVVAAFEKFANFVPVDADRLIRHVRRMHQARLEAEAMRPKTFIVQQNTILHDMLNNKLD